MSEEQACLVRARSDSEGSSKHSFGTMTYTEDRLSGTESGGGEPGNTSHMAASPPDHATDVNESGELLDYNDSSLWWRARRGAALGALAAAAGAGGAAAAALAAAVLPQTGAHTLIENKEHFSAWHRYLLLCTIPILASLVSLIWTQESPRYLLDVGREVDAMMVYQSIHSSNKFRPAAEYRLGELALPAKRRPPALHHVRHSVKMNNRHGHGSRERVRQVVYIQQYGSAGDAGGMRPPRRPHVQAGGDDY
ncbi:unnamed protein product [Spodoptera littoralis]|uniref:Uncharacterized protein n=1 Tax=Spodoptera littoralis TaxID=7109 RepID=A0A9P0N5A4_SPOLI|nr:unnamed protein product [Spodoptera littoralis]CAH1642933.1 unnamed protein product [Spodoptera littoralis]